MRIFDTEKDINLCFNVIEIVQHLNWWVGNMQNQTFPFGEGILKAHPIILTHEMVDLELVFENNNEVFEIFVNPSNFEASVSYKGIWATQNLALPKNPKYFDTLGYQTRLNESLTSLYNSYHSK